MSARRRLLTLLSLVLLLTALLLWHRSRHTADLAAVFTPGGTAQVVASHRGRLWVFLSDIPFRDERRSSFDVDSTDADVFDQVPKMLDKSITRRWELAGFGAYLGRPGALGWPGRGFLLLTFPHWVGAVLLTLYPLHSRRLAGRARRRVASGRCAGCGYDLHGLAADRCPECGAQVTPSARQNVITNR